MFVTQGRSPPLQAFLLVVYEPSEARWILKARPRIVPDQRLSLFHGVKASRDRVVLHEAPQALINEKMVVALSWRDPFLELEVLALRDGSSIAQPGHGLNPSSSAPWSGGSVSLTPWPAPQAGARPAAGESWRRLESRAAGPLVFEASASNS